MEALTKWYYAQRVMMLVQAYSNSLVDHHMVLDLLPSLARAYFCRQLPASLSYGQAAILLSLGLQQNELSVLEAALHLPSNQVLALFNKVCALLTLIHSRDAISYGLQLHLSVHAMCLVTMRSCVGCT